MLNFCTLFTIKFYFTTIPAAEISLQNKIIIIIKTGHHGKPNQPPTIFVHIGQVDLVTEEHKPLVELYRGQHDAVRSAPVLAVVVKRLQQQLWGRGAGEVQANHLQTM